MDKDLMSREALIDKISREIDFERENNMPITAVNAFKITIKRAKSLPAVDAVSVVHGRWYKPIGVAMPPEHHGRHRCSVCDEMAFFKRPGREGLSNYCPNCGAKMDWEDVDG